jgi:hypothetical protein
VKLSQSLGGAKRIKASVALISKLKYSKRRKAHANGKANGVVFDHLLAAKRLVARVGSIDVARQSLDALAKLL